MHTFPSFVVFDFAFFGSRFVLFLASLEPFIGQIELDSSDNRSQLKKLYFLVRCAIKTYLRRRTSSSMSISLAFARTRTLKGGSPISRNLGSLSASDVDKFKLLRSSMRAWDITTSSSSRLFFSRSSDSACGRHIRKSRNRKRWQYLL